MNMIKSFVKGKASALDRSWRNYRCTDGSWQYWWKETTW